MTRTGTGLLRRMLDAILPDRAAPVPARVMKAHEGPGKNRYSRDVRVLTAGSPEETDQEIAEVPVNPVWAAKAGKGVYAPPPEGGAVIIEFLEWNIAYPYAAGVYSDEYAAGKFKKGRLVVTGGKDLRVEFSDDGIYVHGTHRFRARFARGKFNAINAGGFRFEINPDTRVITIDNGGGSSTVLPDAGVTVAGAKINLN